MNGCEPCVFLLNCYCGVVWFGFRFCFGLVGYSLVVLLLNVV